MPPELPPLVVAATLELLNEDELELLLELLDKLLEEKLLDDELLDSKLDEDELDELKDELDDVLLETLTALGLP